MGDRLKGKVAFLTGASMGIGRATATRFALEGAKVTICARGADALADTVADIRAKGGDVTPLKLDVSDLEAYKRAVNETAERHGRLDILVNNAMDASMSPIEDLTLAGWHSCFRVNVDPAFVSTKECFRLMRQGGGGSIINTVSICAIRSVPAAAAYSASKAALLQFSAIAAVEGARYDIRVNTIAPGVLDTHGFRENIHDDPRAAKAIAGGVPMGRLGTPQEGANVMLFLASDESSYVTGVCISVDGGKAVQLDVPGARDYEMAAE